MSAPRTIYLVPARAAPRPFVTHPVRTLVPKPSPKTVPIMVRPAPRTVQQCTRQQPAQLQHNPRQSNNLKRCAVSRSPSVDPIEELLNDDNGLCAPRKRERLSHLSAEEKLNRRKMKNRVAAQTARDRKKVRSQRLEDVVRNLLDENKLLREENNRLRVEQSQQQQMEMLDQTRVAAIESAAFISGPLPRVQAATLILLQLITQLLSSSVSHSTSSRRASSTAYSRISKFEDFDLDQLASELPCEEEQQVDYFEEDWEQSSSSFVQPPMEEPNHVTLVPGSPASSFVSRPSPTPLDDSSLWLEDVKREDPLLSQMAFQQDDDLFQHVDSLSPYNDAFNEEFFNLY